mgnify:CR=1 FL=1
MNDEHSVTFFQYEPGNGGAYKWVAPSAAASATEHQPNHRGSHDPRIHHREPQAALHPRE